MADNNNNGIGCNIILILGIVGTIIWTITNTSNEEFAEMGQNIMILVSIVIVYLVYKFFSNLSSDKETSSNTDNSSVSRNSSRQESPTKTEKTENKGCIISILSAAGLFALFIFIFNTIATDFDINKEVGFVITIIISAAIGLWIYSEMKD